MSLEISQWVSSLIVPTQLTSPSREFMLLRSTHVMSAMLLKSSANVNRPHPYRSLDSIPESHLICWAEISPVSSRQYERSSDFNWMSPLIGWSVPIGNGGPMKSRAGCTHTLGLQRNAPVSRSQNLRFNSVN